MKRKSDGILIAKLTVCRSNWCLDFLQLLSNLRSLRQGIMTTDLGSILSDLCECEVSSTGRPDGSLVLAISLRNGGKFKRVIDRSLTIEEIVRLIRLDLFSEKGALSCRAAIQPCCTDALPTYSNKPLLRTRGSQLWVTKAQDKIN